MTVMVLPLNYNTFLCNNLYLQKTLCMLRHRVVMHIHGLWRDMVAQLDALRA